MEDPHVEALYYDLQPDERVIYEQPPSITWETTICIAHLSKGLLTCELKQHFATVLEARLSIEELLLSWEIDAHIQAERGTIHFVYKDAKIIDRSPLLPESGVRLYGTINGKATVNGTLRTVRSEYPAHPTDFRVSPDVESLWNRYQGYLNGREPLLSMGYFCLTIVEQTAVKLTASAKTKLREKTSDKYNIEVSVLERLGKLTSETGDMSEARKVEKNSTGKPLTEAETLWLETAVRHLIWQLGNYNGQAPSTALKMGDLPKL